MKKVMILMWFVFIQTGYSQEHETLKVAFWNVENLFDLIDNPDKNDDEFAIGGKKDCSESILNLKLDHLSEVLTEMNADIFGLCEVENRKVLEWLNDRYSERNYSIIHYESPDNRGIDNMLYYDPERFTVLNARPITIVFDDGKPTRDILYVQGKFGKEILHIYVNHWPSNYGGKEQAIPRRAETARVLRKDINRILRENPLAEIVLMGDFNEDPTETAVKDILYSTMDVNASAGQLVNLMGPFLGKPKVGTYVWRGDDYFLDQIIVSTGLMDGIGISVQSGSMAIHDKPKYRQQSGKYAHYPFRFWAGNKLLGGYSDHLAVSVVLSLAK